ncbi:MAG: transcription antitermination factor NusB [Proteobacteria bacterium]|nr:transcription antitermination factor NusB [Pseudomonadota bacterium]MBU1715032.1 transcription antitermination factor NusB [Pseudomonadota bacterium]
MVTGIRRKARELALQSLYQSEMGGPAADQALDLLTENFQSNKQALPYARELLAGINHNRTQLDELIQAQAKNWRLERMSIIDLNIMRICVFEMRFTKEVPPSVAINEGLEIAKRYSSDDSASFINGILDSISKMDRE